MFDLLKSEDREKLANLRNASKPPSGPAPTFTPTADSRAATVLAGVASAAAKAAAQRALASRFQVPEEQQQQALTAWSSPTAQAGHTFRPFEKNPSKQARYDLYISKLREGGKGREQSHKLIRKQNQEFQKQKNYCEISIVITSH